MQRASSSEQNDAVYFSNSAKIIGVFGCIQLLLGSSEFVLHPFFFFLRFKQIQIYHPCFLFFIKKIVNPDHTARIHLSTTPQKKEERIRLYPCVRSVVRRIIHRVSRWMHMHAKFIGSRSRARTNARGVASSGRSATNASAVALFPHYASGRRRQSLATASNSTAAAVQLASGYDAIG